MAAPDSPPNSSSHPSAQHLISPPQHSQSSQTLTLEDTDHSNQFKNQREEDDLKSLNEDNHDPDRQIGNPTLSPHLPQSAQTLTLGNTQQSDQLQAKRNMQDEDGPKVLDEDNQGPDHQFGNPSISPLTSPAPTRRTNKRKKGVLSWQKQQAIEKKVQILLKTFHPIPFIPVKPLDLDRYEKLLKRLELWDFVHTEFDKRIRTDLVAQLIVNFDPKARCSHVNGLRVNVNRPTLARTLKLPVRKEKSSSGAQETVVLDVEEYGEISEFVEEFLSNWVLLHGEAVKLPDQVMNWNTEIKSGLAEKVDWAGILWFMMEKELSQGVKLEDCYYASHLQYLIKSQREELFLEEEPEVEVKEDEGLGTDKTVEVNVESVVVNEPNVESVVVKEPNVESVVAKEPNVELTLGQENVDKEEVKGGEEMNVDEIKEGNMMVVDEPKDDVVQGNWILQHCDVQKAIFMDAGEGSKLEEEGEMTLGRGQEDTKLEEEGEGTCVEEVEDESKLEEEGEGAFVEKQDDKNNLDGEGEGKLAEEEEDEMKLEEEGEEIFTEREEDEMKLEEEGEGTFAEEEEDGMKLEEEGEGTFTEREEDETKLEEEVEGDDEEEIEGGDEEEVEGDDEEENDGEFNLMPKIHDLGSDGFAGNLQGIDMNNFSYAVSEQFDDQSNMNLVSPRAEPYSSSGGQSFLGMKRDISYDQNLLHDPPNRGNKRPRADGSMEKSSDFGSCMDQIQLWVGKARVTQEAKEKEVEELTKNQQILVSEVQRRDNMIEHVQMTMYEELKKKDAVINRLDRELFVMSNLVNGYRDALKATRIDFAKYRERCQLPEEPIYKDVGPGGLMLSTMEIERQRLKREEEDRVNRAIVEQNWKKFEEEWVVIFEGYFNRVRVMDTKLVDLEKKVSQIKEVSAMGKVSETVDTAAPMES